MNVEQPKKDAIYGGGCWQFWIDAGGTFTDCVALAPNGTLRTGKVLSSGSTKGRGTQVAGNELIDPSRRGEPEGFWTGYELRLLDDRAERVWSGTVKESRANDGGLTFAPPLPPDLQQPGLHYELQSPEEAPLLAIRMILGLPLAAPLPPMEVRLGTTRGTNALLERKGARTTLVVTRGFADVLLIGNQDRPRLFDLAIRMPEPLFQKVIEIDERLVADGSVLRPIDAAAARRQLQALRTGEVDSLAICLVHAFANPVHEDIVARIAAELGFREVSVSSRVAPLIKLVSRGDTTVLDAYLNPVLREYVHGLERQLTPREGEAPAEPSAPEAQQELRPPGQELCGERPATNRLRLMTSAGGLVDANGFLGKDSLLSGPAGGVIGYSRVARQAGFPRAIGFDMGGTSTDVSRFDGEYEYEYETTKAGVRVVSPMLAIETVAAGGGSLCGFDGVQLFVGPESAGADPGPACYGRGGPLAVTDVNLVLGRLLPEEFPFPLQTDVVLERLQALVEQIAASPLGVRYDPLELAEGFVAIANANMTRAIRRISVAKGYDPAEYALVTFGGAGGQHACAIADALGMRTILAHPLAGLLSAYGIGLADVRRHAERAVLRPYSTSTLKTLNGVFGELEAGLRDEVLREGIADSRIDAPRRSLDLRYRGVESTITVPCPEDGDYGARYEALHEQLYGYRHTGRELEVVAARVEVVGRTAGHAVTPQPAILRRAVAARETTIRFAGRDNRAGVFRRGDLRPGNEFDGPAILNDGTSTLVVDPGWSARVNETGVVVLSKTEDASTSTSPPAAPEPVNRASVPDPVALELFNSHFASIAEQMGITLQHTAVSTNVKERLDFSCALFDPRGNLVVNAPHIPVHLGAMSETVKSVLADQAAAGEPLAPGDVLVTNDPYRGGSHLPDITVVTPVHDDATGELIFVTASRAHHAEIGGISPGSMPPFSTNLAQEGVLIRNFKLVDRGRSREAELRALLLAGPYPTRRVEDNLSDLAAQVAANRQGIRLLRQLIAEEGLPTVQAYMRFIQQAAAEKCRQALARLKSGEYRRVDHLDDGSPISVRIAIESGRAIVDFTGTGPVLGTSLNANRAIVTAAVMYVFRCLIDEEIPLNSGVLEPVEILLPECLLNPPASNDPARCPAIVGGNVETSQRVVDVLLGALGLAAASQGTMNNLTFGDGTFGYYETICGGSGATPHAPGADAVHTHMTNTRLTDVEVLERRYPVRVQEFAIRRGSGGAGTHRGGDGIIRRIEFLQPLTVSMLSQRRREFAPFGLAGGESGSLGRNTLTRSNGETLDLGGSFQIDVTAGDVLTIETPGGGGYGDLSAPSREPSPLRA